MCAAVVKKESGPPVSRDELKERLQKKLEALRQQRKADEAAEKAKKAKEWRESTLAKGRESAKRKRKPEERSQGSKKAAAPQKKQQQAEKADGVAAGAKTTKILNPTDTTTQQHQGSTKPSKAAGGGGLQFTKVDFGDDALGRKHKQKKKTKAELLDEAEKKKSELAQAEKSKDGQVGFNHRIIRVVIYMFLIS